MAAPIPCSMCAESPDADFLVTSRNPDFVLGDQATVGICVDCLIKLGLAMYAGQVDEATPTPEPEPAPAPKRSRKAPEPEPAEVIETEAAAHVNG